MNRLWTIVALLVVFVAGFLARDVVPAARAQAGPQMFELRTYTAPDGKLGNLHARFRDHTLRIFEKHGYATSCTSPPRMPHSRRTR